MADDNNHGEEPDIQQKQKVVVDTLFDMLMDSINGQPVDAEMVEEFYRAYLKIKSKRG